MLSFFKARIRSIRFAFNGLCHLIKEEHNFKVQVVIALFVTAAGFYYAISMTEWFFQTFAIGLVLSLEAINTAIEKTADYINPEFDHKIGKIKDLSAAAVTIGALTAFVIGLAIYIPKIF